MYVYICLYIYTHTPYFGAMNSHKSQLFWCERKGTSDPYPYSYNFLGSSMCWNKFEWTNNELIADNHSNQLQSHNVCQFTQQIFWMCPIFYCIHPFACSNLVSTYLDPSVWVYILIIYIYIDLYLKCTYIHIYIHIHMYTHTIYIYIYLFIHISTTHFSVTTIGGLAPKCSQPVNRGLVMNPSTFGKTFRPQDAAASNRFPSSEQFDPGRQGLEDEFPLKKIKNQGLC